MALQQRLMSGRAFTTRQPAVVGRHALSRRSSVVVRAQYDDEEQQAPSYRREWPDPTFIKEVTAAFPEQGIANVEEARVLYSNAGYTYLDVRTALEFDEVGHVKNAVNIPWMNAKRVYDPETRTKKIVKSENKDFVAQVKKRFPKPDTKLLIGCNDGRTYSRVVLETLDEAGYTHIAGLRGGYNAWFKTWDNKLARRRYGEYAEDYSGMGETSCGIHASGAGFAKVDAADRYIPPSY